MRTINAEYMERARGLVDSIWRTESSSSHSLTITSSAGARGPMQFMPATRQHMISTYGVDPWASVDSAKRAGALYIGELMETFDGDLTKAVAGYNAGPGRVQQAVRNGGDEWLEWLRRDQTRRNGKSETYNYVRSVLGSGAVSGADVSFTARHDTGRTTDEENEAEARRRRARAVAAGAPEEEVAGMDNAALLGIGFLFLMMSLLGNMNGDSPAVETAQPTVAPQANAPIVASATPVIADDGMAAAVAALTPNTVISAASNASPATPLASPLPQLARAPSTQPALAAG